MANNLEGLGGARSLQAAEKWLIERSETFYDPHEILAEVCINIGENLTLADQEMVRKACRDHQERLDQREAQVVADL